jgi:hypothetical protein
MFAANTFQIQPATSADDLLLHRLARCDHRRPLTAPTLIGAIHGMPVAAISLVDGRVVSDPCVDTSALTAHLRMRARAHQAFERTPSLVDRLRAGVRPVPAAQKQAA